MKPISILFMSAVIFGSHFSFANAPKVGKKAAARYFAGEVQNSKQQVADEAQIRKTSEGGGSSASVADHFLAFGFSHYTDSESYKWGQEGKEVKIGKWGFDMTYRIEQHNNVLDKAIRVSYTEFEVLTKRAGKISLMYAITLPEAGSEFPLYFGAAAGPGIFFKQLPEESPLSLDYQLYAGLRLFNVMEKTGFYVEGGLKNHLQLTSDGQLNGTYISAGAVFTF